MALWTPADGDITPAIWLDASDSSTITIATGVSQFNDKSSNGLNLTQVDTVSQPARISAAQNGLDVIRFDGSNDELTRAAWFPNVFTILFVAKNNNLALSNAAAISQNSNTSNYGRLLCYIERDQGTVQVGLQVGTVVLKTGTRTGGYNLYGLTRSGTTAGVIYNGVSAAGAVNSNTIESTTFRLGQGGGSAFTNFDFCELLVFSSVLSLTEIQLYEGYLAWKWGIEANLPSGHPYEDSAPTKPNILVRTAFEQLYSLRFVVVFEQLYGDAARLRNRLDQYYGDAARLRRRFEQFYGDAPKYRAAFEQLYNLHAGLRAAFEQHYSIADGQIRAAFDQLYNLQDKDLIRQTLDMIYVLAAGEALVQRFDIDVTCAGVIHTSMSNINIEQDDNTFHMVGELQLYDEAEYLQYQAYVSEVEITVDSWTVKLIAGMPREARTPGQSTYIIPLFSRTVWLEALTENSIGYLQTAGELSGMAKTLVETLAAPISVTWSMVDWFIPPGRLAVNEGDNALAIIRRIVEAAGGIIQTDPDGNLVCRPEYPVSVNQWETIEPDYYLTDQDDFFQIDHAPELRSGYNWVNVSDQQLATGGLSMEVTEIDGYTKEVRVYQLPWDDNTCINLRHSGDQSRVSIVAGGALIETISDEQVEIIGGSGRTTKPFYRLITSDYRDADLGTIEIAEDGTIKTATAENSLVLLNYWTRCWKFTVTDRTTENVQFFPEVIDI